MTSNQIRSAFPEFTDVLTALAHTRTGMIWCVENHMSRKNRSMLPIKLWLHERCVMQDTWAMKDTLELMRSWSDAGRYFVIRIYPSFYFAGIAPHTMCQCQKPLSAHLNPLLAVPVDDTGEER